MLKVNEAQIKIPDFAKKYGFQFHKFDGFNARYVKNSSYGGSQMSFAASDGTFDDSYAGCGNVLFDMAMGSPKMRFPFSGL